MYSCHKPRNLTIVLEGRKQKGFESAKKCRFDQRYDPMHQALGCSQCTRQWDAEYLKAAGLIK